VYFVDPLISRFSGLFRNNKPTDCFIIRIMETGQKAPSELISWRKKLSKAEPTSISR
jgi:hypothetical protein